MTIRGRLFADLTFGEDYRVVKTYSFDEFVVRGDGKMPIVLPAGKATTVTIHVFDKFDNPTKFQNVPVWASSNVVFASVTPDSSGYSAMIRSIGPMGAGQWSVRGDADLGDGVRELVIMDDISVVPGDPFRSSVSYGPVVE